MTFLKKHKKILIFCATITIVSLFSKILFAYDDIIIHPTLTGEMAEIYNANFADKLTAEEIGWMKQGSTDEDKSLGLAIRSENHFYNPNGSKEWVDNSFRKDIVATPLLTSKEWAHDRLAQVTFPGGDYTWETAIKDYVIGDKKRAYQGLGHILHLIEDAAVPAHTRSDLHISPKELEDYNNGSIWKKILGYYLTDYEPYESWTGNEAKSGGLKFGWAKELIQENKQPVILDSLDKYFDRMAFYSNKNFFSKDTIYVNEFPEKYIESFEKLQNGMLFYFVYGIDEDGQKYKLTSYIFKYNNEAKTIEKVYIIDDQSKEIHSDYWSRLAPNAVLNGAGVIKLFKDEAEKFAKTPKLADLNPLTKVFHDIGRAAEDNTGPVLIRNYLVGKQLVTNFAVYSLKMEARLAGNTIINTVAIANDVLQNEYRRAQEVASEAKMIVAITYNNVKSIAEAKYNRAQEVGSEAKYIVNIARRGILSGIKNLSDPVFSGIKNRLSMFGAASIANPDAKERIKKDDTQDQIGFLQKDKFTSGQNLSFIGPKRIYGPFKENAIPVDKVSKILPPVIQENFDAEERQPDNQNVSGPENTGDIFVSDNDRDSAIVNGSGDILSQENSASGLSESIYSPPVIFASAEFLSYSSSAVSVLTPTPTSAPTPTPTPTLVPTATSSPQLTSTPTLTPAPILSPTPTLTLAPSPTPIVTPEPAALPGKITDLYASTGLERGQVALSWSAPANAFSYDIIYSDIPFNESYASEYFMLNLAADNIASQNLSLDNLAPGKEFFFNVKAQNKEGDISDSSNMASAFSNGYADSIVISEIQIAGVDLEGNKLPNDEFVELYNPTEQEINLKDWDLKRKTKNGNESNMLNKIQGVIKSHGYFLITPRANCGENKTEACYKGSSIGDDEYTTNSFMADNNTILLYNNDGKVIDKIGWGEVFDFETSVFVFNPFAGQSVERKAHRNSSAESMVSGQDKYQGNAWDANDNSQDFILRASPDPRGAGDGYMEPRLNTAPAITILSPQNNQLFLHGETIDFSANISDAEDLIFPDEKISWVSDKLGIIGNSKSFSFDNFLSGANRITIDAIDSDNVMASAYRDIFIRNNSWKNLGQIKDLGKNRDLNYPKIAIDSKGKTHIAALENKSLIYLTNETGEWKSFVIFENHNATVHSAEIKIDSHDNIFIIFEVSGGCSYPAVSYVRKTADSWTNPKNLASFSAGYSVAVGNKGEIYSVVNAVTPYNYCMKHYDNGMRFNRTAEGILQKEIIIPAPANTAVYLPQVAIDKNNIPYLFAVARTGEPGIFYTSFDENVKAFNSWEKANLTYDSVSTLPVVPRFDAMNNIHVFIRETSPKPEANRGIWHMVSADFKIWNEERLPGTSDINTLWFANWSFNPVFDSRGKIHLVWQHDKSPYYQTNFSGTWSAPMDILGEGIYGMRPALAIDKSNNLHLLYQPFDKNLQAQINYAIDPETE